jgi:hypothetical protein
MAVVSWVALNLVLRPKPSALVLVGGLVLGGMFVGSVLLLAYNAVAQVLAVTRPSAAFILAGGLCLIVFGEPVFAFTATQSYQTALHTILPLRTPGLINVWGNMVVIALLFGVPSVQFRVKEKTHRRWDVVDDMVVRWIPRLAVGAVLLITLLYHYWGGPLAGRPLPTLAVGSLFAAVVLPPILRPVVRCIIREGPDSVLYAPGHWLSTAKREICREFEAADFANWSDAYGLYNATVQEFWSPTTRAARSTRKKNGGLVWIDAQRRTYQENQLRGWQRAKLEALPGWDPGRFPSRRRPAGRIGRWRRNGQRETPSTRA